MNLAITQSFDEFHTFIARETTTVRQIALFDKKIYMTLKNVIAHTFIHINTTDVVDWIMMVSHVREEESCE